MKKFAKRFIKIGIIVSIIAILFVVGYFSLIFFLSPVSFDANKIKNSNLSISIYDTEKRPLEHTFINGDYVKLEQIPKHTVECFLSIEDKNFYNHKGINYKRIISATAKNLASFSFKEGASTISQQLIKNTHLTNEKSIKRKINEIKLTKILEKEFSKDQILEYYLNIIYFGDNCYGIQNASEHYFSKPVSKLTLDESAILAGIIKSPNRYHPVKQYNNCMSRRNLVLSEMLKDNKISNTEYKSAKNIKTLIEINSDSLEMNSYAKATIKEAESILKMPEKQIAIGNYRIFTNMDKDKQKALENSIDKSLKEDCAMISLNANNGKIEAYVEKSNLPLTNVVRPPASAIKPILVYAPAVNENIISPSTVILDEKITINGYEPQNIGNKEYGYVNVKKALSNSLNIPAVKILSYIGLNKAKSYLERQNIDFDEKDNNLALALGGMTYGIGLKNLTNCYQTFANYGVYNEAKFIDYILDSKGKVIYKNNENSKTIYRSDTAFLMTDMLHSCSKTGTAKRLSDLDFYVASKTGTSSNAKKNLDAYNISYTSEDVVGCWIGNLDNTPINIVGGGTPTAFVKKYMQQIYVNQKPNGFKIPSSIVEEEIDTLARDNEHIIYRANNFLPERYREKAYFSRFNPPKENYSNKLTVDAVNIEGKVLNGVANISFNANLYCLYDIYRITDDKEELIVNISNKNGPVTYTISQSPNKLYKYYIKTKLIDYKTKNELQSGNSNYIELYYSA